jgi:drug/metabolite transporter (DMT)-like permease
MTARAHRPILAIALRLAAAVLIAAMLALVKLAGEAGVALPEILFWRQCLSVPLLLAWMALTGNTTLLRSQRLWVHGRRAMLGLTSMSLLLGAALFMPLAELTTLTFTGPLFAVALSALLLKEAVGRWRWGAVALGFAGVAIVAQPSGEALPALGVAMGSLAALLNGLISVQLRDLGRTEHPLTSVFMFSAFSMIPLGLLLPFFATPHPPLTYAILLGTGLCGMLAQIGLTSALRFGTVASVTVMDYSGLIWSTLAGWLIWKHLPPLTTWIGAPLIVAAGLIVVWREHRLAIAPAKEIAA